MVFYLHSQQKLPYVVIVKKSYNELFLENKLNIYFENHETKKKQYIKI